MLQLETWRRRAAILTTTWMLSLLATSCGEDPSTTPKPEPDAPTLVFLPANPAGQLIEGPGNENAFAHLGNLPASPTPRDLIATDGTLLDRLSAVIAPNATVDEVNAALEEHGATVVSMTELTRRVSLKIAGPTSRPEVETLASSIEATGAFSLVWPSVGLASPEGLRSSNRTAGVTQPNSHGLVRRDAPPNATVHPFQQRTKLPATWNLRHATSSGRDVNGLLTADFGSTPPASLPRLLLDADPQVDPLFPNAAWCQSGLIIGEFGGPAPGIVQEPEFFLVGERTSGLDMFSIMINLLELELEGFDSHWVLCTPQTYRESVDYTERVVDAVIWRSIIQAHDEYRNAVHIVSAGSHPSSPIFDANDMSPWALSASDINDTIENGLDPAQQAVVASVLGPDVEPTSLPSVTNVLTVGAKDLNGGSFTAPGAHVETIGDVVGLCVEDCVGEIGAYRSPEQAAAQVAGLSALLWSLSPDLSSDDVLLRLQHAQSAASTESGLDFYIAALSADRNLASASARKALLDVATTGTDALQPDGRFDETDIEMFLAYFEDYELEREANGENRDDSRFDLNGDGFTGGDYRDKFDLDVNSLPSFGSVVVDGEFGSFEYDEREVTDREILCYYAHSSIYEGSEEGLAELEPHLSCSPLTILVDVDAPLQPGVVTPVLIQVGLRSEDGVDGWADVSLDLSAQGGLVGGAIGTTNELGEFETTVTGASPGPLLLQIEAETDTGVFAERTVEIEVASGGVSITAVASTATVGFPAPITFTVREAQNGGSGLSGYQLTFDTTGGDLGATSGATDANGRFATTVTPVEATVQIDVRAESPEGDVHQGTTVIVAQSLGQSFDLRGVGNLRAQEWAADECLAESNDCLSVEGTVSSSFAESIRCSNSNEELLVHRDTDATASFSVNMTESEGTLSFSGTARTAVTVRARRDDENDPSHCGYARRSHRYSSAANARGSIQAPSSGVIQVSVQDGSAVDEMDDRADDYCERYDCGPVVRMGAVALSTSGRFELFESGSIDIPVASGQWVSVELHIGSQVVTGPHYPRVAYTAVVEAAGTVSVTFVPGTP